MVINVVMLLYLKIGPWYPLKIIAARIWLTWKLLKVRRVLNNIIDDEYKNVNSDGYKQIGKLAPTNVEIEWEQPHLLKTMTVQHIYQFILNVLDSKI